VFAVGDARAGSVKRVASAVGEGSIVVSSVHQVLAEEQGGDAGTASRGRAGLVGAVAGQGRRATAGQVRVRDVS
jgi:hypothetical protein